MVFGCRSAAGDAGTESGTNTKQAVSNVDLLDGLITTLPQPLGLFTGQPMMGGMSQMYVIGQQPGIVPVMPGNASGMMQGSSSGLAPNNASVTMAGFPESMMQGNSSTMMQMNIAMSVQQQHHMMSGMSGPAAAASPMNLAQPVSASLVQSLPVSICVIVFISLLSLFSGYIVSVHKFLKQKW